MVPEMFKKGKRGCTVDINALGCLPWKFSHAASLDSTEIMMKVCGSYDSCLCMAYLRDLNGVHLEIGAAACSLNKPPDPRLMKL